MESAELFSLTSSADFPPVNFNMWQSQSFVYHVGELKGTPKMEAVRTPETLVTNYKTTWRYNIQEHYSLHFCSLICLVLLTMLSVAQNSVRWWDDNELESIWKETAVA
jgi:hypothetical protein